MDDPRHAEDLVRDIFVPNFNQGQPWLCTFVGVRLPHKDAGLYACTVTKGPEDEQWIRSTRVRRIQKFEKFEFARVPVRSGSPKREWNHLHESKLVVSTDFKLLSTPRRLQGFLADERTMPPSQAKLLPLPKIEAIRCVQCGRVNGNLGTPQDENGNSFAPVALDTMLCLGCRREQQRINGEEPAKPCLGCGCEATSTNTAGEAYCVICASERPGKFFYIPSKTHRNAGQVHAVEEELPLAKTKANTCKHCGNYFDGIALECDFCSGNGDDHYRICVDCRELGVHKNHNLLHIKINAYDADD